MKLFQRNVIGGNELNCFKATQMLGKGPTDKLRGDLELWYQGGT